MKWFTGTTTTLHNCILLHLFCFLLLLMNKPGVLSSEAKNCAKLHTKCIQNIVFIHTHKGNLDRSHNLIVQDNSVSHKFVSPVVYWIKEKLLIRCKHCIIFLFYQFPYHWNPDVDQQFTKSTLIMSYNHC